MCQHQWQRSLASQCAAATVPSQRLLLFQCARRGARSTLSQACSEQSASRVPLQPCTLACAGHCKVQQHPCNPDIAVHDKRSNHSHCEITAYVTSIHHRISDITITSTWNHPPTKHTDTQTHRPGARLPQVKDDIFEPSLLAATAKQALNG